MAPWNPMDRVSSWYWTGAVTLLALILRMVNVQHPSKIVFDETYYANDAWALLHYGYERNSENNGPGIAAHPPFGKWCIALGEWLFGYNSFGWRFSAALFGSLSVLLIVRVARRLFRSTLLGCTAGALLSLEGLHFVSSRMSLLDIFLLFWVFAAFALLLADRDAMRARLAAALEGGSSLKHGARRSGWREWPWRRLAAAVCLGLALSVKWSALWFVVAFVVLVIVWEIQARRTAGVRHPFLETLGWETPWLLLAGVIILAVYLATWTGWFVTDGGFERHWAEENNASVWYLPDAIVSLWHYQSFIYDFHAHLDAKHAYQSTPMSWLFMERPVLYYAEGGDCGAAECKATISGMGTPLLWWSFVPAWFVCLWQWIVRRDWRAGAIVICAAAGILPWFMYPDRTMFFFYTLPAVPFFVLAVTMALGLVLGREGASQERRAVGAGVYIGYMALIAVCFAYFYPVLTGNSLPIDQWNDRMWMESWK
jgi:dolichyl-phosphate-mannose--protein O-mannosyl transferase